MSVKYNVIERPSPSNPQARKKFYPSIKASGRRTQRQIAEMISRISSVSTGDTMAVIEGLLTVIPQELAAGNIVELGDFGSFWLKANTEGADTAEEVRPSRYSPFCRTSRRASNSRSCWRSSSFGRREFFAVSM